MAVELRQTLTVTVTIDVPAAPWDDIKYPGWTEFDPVEGHVVGEPPTTHREFLEQELHRCLQQCAPADMYVAAVSARPDGEPYECGRVLDPNDVEPF